MVLLNQVTPSLLLLVNHSVTSELCKHSGEKLLLGTKSSSEIFSPLQRKVLRTVFDRQLSRGMASEMTKVVLLLGGSGETGKQVLKELNANPMVSRIILVGRRLLEVDDQPKVRLPNGWGGGCRAQR